MSEAVRTISTISEYNSLHGLKTQHPQVAFVEFHEVSSAALGKHTYGFYTLFLKETKGCVINYGQTQYDFDCQTVVSMAPGQVVGYTSVEGVPAHGLGILFHPDFLHGTALEKKMKDYSFFSYASNEALHLSEDEIVIIRSCMRNIQTELQHPIDKHTRGLVIANLELLLDYCMRFYERQFVTRQDMNITALSRFSELLSEYIVSGRTAIDGIPTVKYFADRVHLSSNYFGDMVKAETGKSAQEYIALRLYEHAKRQLAESELTIKEIALQTGFRHPQHFVRFFKKHAGVTPSEYRLSC
ncbi:MAG: helix-turn-helix domain-containing protein [Paludibacteraceae bacterium]